jgi:hypothetical protein
MGMTLDISDFAKGFKKLVEQSAPEAIDKGLFKAGVELLHDAIYISRGAPKEIGDLWASGSIQGAGAIIAVPDGKPVSPPSGFKSMQESGGVAIAAGFNREYAAYLHEGHRKDGSYTIKWWTYMKGAHDPGPKYLESKMVSKTEKYKWIIGEYLKSLLGG